MLGTDGDATAGRLLPYHGDQLISATLDGYRSDWAACPASRFLSSFGNAA